MVQVRRSTVIDAPIDAVWGMLRDFNGHERWHPAVAESRIEEGRRPDEIGCVRRFRLTSGGELREQLLRLSDRDHSFTYCILEAPIPLIDYVAILRLKPVTDGRRTFWEWSSEFRTPPGEESELAALVGEQIYEAGFDAIKAAFGQAPGLRPRSSAAQAPVPVAADRAIDGNGMVVERFGGPEVMHWERITASPPGLGEVRLKHSAIGLNYIDVYTRSGYYPLIEPPAVPGMEAAGVVLDIGPGVHGILPGDRVAYACAPPGAYAEVRTMKAELLVVLPDDIGDELAAAVMLKGMSAEFLLASRPPGAGRRPYPGPCRGRRRRPAALPMGSRAGRHGHRHRRQHREGAHRPQPWLRLSHRLYGGGFRRAGQRDHQGRGLPGGL